MNNDQFSETPFSGAEADERFPSGNWTGWFRQFGSRSRMLIRMWFQNGKVHATGSDYVGPFIFAGNYDTETGVIAFVKTYAGQEHNADIWYEGACGDKGVRGGWKFIGFSGSGEFHIWPESQSEGETDAVYVEQKIDIRGSVPIITIVPV